MNPIIDINHSFFRDVNHTRELVLAGKFNPVNNPIDQVVYQGINADLPAEVQFDVVSGIARVIGRLPRVKVMFARATHHGQEATNKIHSDRSMGLFAAHIYLSTWWPAGAGTSFWINNDQGALHNEDTDASRVRCNEMSDWTRYLLVQGRYNQGLIHHGDAWHLAEPIGGWGSTLEDCRLVITAFFD